MAITSVSSFGVNDLRYVFFERWIKYFTHIIDAYMNGTDDKLKFENSK